MNIIQQQQFEKANKPFLLRIVNSMLFSYQSMATNEEDKADLYNVALETMIKYENEKYNSTYVLQAIKTNIKERIRQLNPNYTRKNKLRIQYNTDVMDIELRKQASDSIIDINELINNKMLMNRIQEQVKHKRLRDRRILELYLCQYSETKIAAQIGEKRDIVKYVISKFKRDLKEKMRKGEI